MCGCTFVHCVLHGCSFVCHGVCSPACKVTFITGNITDASLCLFCSILWREAGACMDAVQSVCVCVWTCESVCVYLQKSQVCVQHSPSHLRTCWEEHLSCLITASSGENPSISLHALTKKNPKCYSSSLNYIYSLIFLEFFSRKLRNTNPETWNAIFCLYFACTPYNVIEKSFTAQITWATIWIFCVEFSVSFA